ncbi:MAG: hypothetical protein QXP45_04420 [Thermoproteota archaeon]
MEHLSEHIYEGIRRLEVILSEDDEASYVVSKLSDIERALLEDRNLESFPSTGARIVSHILEDDDPLLGMKINVIPARGKGLCHNTLLVIIGSADSDQKIENRILEALEHAVVMCSGITKTVIFWAMRWNSQAWARHARSFKGIMVLLKPFFACPTILET